MMRRHDLLAVEPAAWEAMLRRHPDLTEAPLVADWSRLGRPVIVRRRSPGEDPATVPAALPLPPCHGKLRLAFDLVSMQGSRSREAVLLRDAAAVAPAAWQPAIAALVDVGGPAPRVFGALLWEHLTGLPYLTIRSDLDLSWTVADEHEARALVELLARLELGPVRLDGELEMPDGAAVNWREFAHATSPSTPVLVKTMNGVALRARAALFQAAGPE